MSLDLCPSCGRRIGDHDDDGFEAESGQRFCLAHRPGEDVSSKVRPAIVVSNSYDSPLGRSAVVFPAPTDVDRWPMGVFLWFESQNDDFDADVAKLAAVTGLPVVGE